MEKEYRIIESQGGKYILYEDVKEAMKLQELVKDMENQTGRALVDVQNWLSKEGKLSTEITNKVLRDLIEESEK